MTKTLLFILTLILTIDSNGQAHLVDSTVYLSFGNTKIECLKRYVDYEYGPEFGNDTIFYSPPRFRTYLFKDDDCKYIKTFRHTEYGYTEDPDTRELWISGKCETDSTHISKFLGEIDKDSLHQILLDSITFLDTKTKYPLNMNFTIEISTKNGDIQIPRASLDYQYILKYELDNLQKGDCVIIRDINFNSTMSKYPSHLYAAGYWKIK